MPKDMYTKKFNPHGPCMYMDEEMMEGLGMEGMAVGDMVKVTGYAKITSTSEYANEDGKDKSMSMQMTEMKVDRMESDKEMETSRMNSMYPGSMG